MKYLFIFIFLIGCNKDIIIQGKTLQLSYDYNFRLKHGDHILIDNNKFIHETNIDSLKLDYVLPMNFISIKRNNKIFKDKVNAIYIMTNLAKQLKKKNYLILNQVKLLTQGTLIITKKDSTLIKIKCNQKYPINIKVIN